MDIKRKCAEDADEAGTSANKRSKPSTNDDEETDLNSLKGMPNEILDEIFDLLELADRKSLSETCKRLSEFFSQVRNLKKVWLNMMKAAPKLTEQTMSMSSRRLTHRNVIGDLSNPKTLVEYFSPSSDNMKCQISSLQIQQHVDIIAMATHLLPRFFNNLTHLEFRSITSITGIWGNGITEKLNFDRVAMPQLEFLAIYRNLFAFLDRHYIDFSTERLHTIRISDDSEIRYSYSGNIFSFDNILDIDNRIHALIAKQKNLRVLILSITGDFFKRELIVQSKLKTFRLLHNHHPSLKLPVAEPTRKNFVDFIVSQTELEDVRALIEPPLDISDNERLRIWRKNLLNLRVNVMRIEFSTNSYGPCFLLSVNESMLTGEPNLAVRKVELYIDSSIEQPGVVSRFLAAVASKFPKLHVIDLQIGFGITWCELSMLGRLEKLSELHVEGYFKGLETVTLPKLRCFGFGYPNCLSDDKFRQFLVRHSTITEIHIDFYQQQIFINWLEFALTHLKHVKLIVFSDNRFPESDIEKISSLIATYAQPGFRLIGKTYKLKLMKREDEKVVIEIEGRWKIGKIDE